MGIPVYNFGDMFSDDDSNTTYSCCCCDSCVNSCRHTYSLPSDHCAKSKCNNKTSSSLRVDNSAYKDIIGNCKEVRIDENTCNLRIVGNNNRIRIAVNTGDLIVIGNNTRLKIQHNHGQIKYTGNDGRICLGYQSPQQLVDYIGCNGILKIACGSKKTSAEAKQKLAFDDTANENKSPVNLCGGNDKDSKLYCHLTYDEGKTYGANKTTRNVYPVKTTKSKGKSHSFGGPSCINHDQSSAASSHFTQTFDRMFQQFDRKSMPNLSQQSSVPTACRSREQPPATIIQTIGNIVIANASNVCISPCVTTTA